MLNDANPSPTQPAAYKDLRHLRETVPMAQEVGEGMGRGEVLQ